MNSIEVKKTHHLVKWVSRFANEAGIIPESGKVCVAVSGGMDSMLLLYVAKAMEVSGILSKVSAVHVNHGTRKENYCEQVLVCEFAKKLGVPLVVKKIKLSMSDGNFESRARDQRYAIFNQERGAGDLIYMAHHIDDSFEWSLMARLKTGSSESGLGIPVISRSVARPFMCLTKKQIKRFVREIGIPFLNDPSNGNIRFERNYLREKIISPIKGRFPGYLRHYVYQSNDLAGSMGISRLVKKNADNFQVFEDSCGGISLVNGNFEKEFASVENKILSIIQNRSTDTRGVLRSQVNKIIHAARRGSGGPLRFSGGVLGYIFHGMLYFINEKDLYNIDLFDEMLLGKLIAKKGAHIPGIDLNEAKKQLNGQMTRFLVFSDDPAAKGIWPSIKKIHSLLPKTSSWTMEKGVWLQSPFKLLYNWSRPKNKMKKLRLIVPL
ncbi:MAG: tRNA lysidine(34) synthetase TilS [Bacteriovoracaceae bacterium]|nr:tRNA lysidine(34) synthetase TilS [Bacteriovoracaceae bacterium]